MDIPQNLANVCASNAQILSNLFNPRQLFKHHLLKFNYELGIRNYESRSSCRAVGS
ncbi:protein of unknown function [Candidatus Promineifilum breve]|uniref:Uncharacterized protein n=1 Tax=Candidatus Promineifilum breve TaxID=1806508 RepID=A0A170PH24_9CHLR|nr:protein of unknown function [Candidatus Promineifilum breve]